jgi:hypothetical protein
MDEIIITAYFYKLFPKEPIYLEMLKVLEIFLRVVGIFPKVLNSFHRILKKVIHSLLISD